MSEADQDAILGRTLRECKAAQTELAALYAEAEHIGNYVTAVGHSLRTNHSLGGVSFGNSIVQFDPAMFPTVQRLTTLVAEIATVSAKKDRLEKLLGEAGYPK